MKIVFAILFFSASLLLSAQDRFQINAPLFNYPTSGGTLIFSPSGGTTGTTRYVGLSYPTAPSDTIVFTKGTLCSNPAVTCPVGSSVISLASALYNGPNCIPTSGCTSGSGGFGTPITATATGSGTTINAQVIAATVTLQNNMSTTSLPASWFPAHWKYIPSNPSSTPVTIPTGSSGCNGSCVGNALTTSNICYAPPCGGVGSLATIVNVWAIPGATAPVTPPIDPLTGTAAKATYVGFTSTAQNTTGYGHPQILFTNQNEQNCGSTFCTWMAQDFWILADGGPAIAAWESDMQIWDSTGAWTFALQCRIHGNASPLTSGWGYGNQSSGLTQIPGTSSSNCPSATQWLHVMYYGTRNQSAGTFTIVSLTLQSAPGGPAGTTGYAVFPINVTYNVDTGEKGNSCTNQIQLDGYCNGSNCSSTQETGAYYALNNVTCGTGTPPVVGPTTQIYN